MTASIANFFTATRTTARQDSDDFVVAPESMRSTVHDNPNIVIQPDEFKLYGKQCVRCNAIANNYLGWKYVPGWELDIQELQ
jgi:hypothetical protein